MRVAGIIGGVSWYSTADLYQYINTRVQDALGGNSCAKLVIANVNMQEIIDQDTFEKKGAVLAEAAKRCEGGGADFVVICSNGCHEWADIVQAAVNIPLIHIADGTADRILAAGMNRIGLLGAKDTMVHDFYKKRLAARGIEVLIPSEEDMDYIDYVVYEETGKGFVKPETCARFYEIAGKLVEAGAEGVILGCTEIGELMQQDKTDIPLFDTTRIHAEVIADLCLLE